MKAYLPLHNDFCCEAKNVVAPVKDYSVIYEGILDEPKKHARTLLFGLLSQAITNDILTNMFAGIGGEYSSAALDGPTQRLALMMEANIHRFSAAKSIAQADEFNRILRKGGTFTEMKRKAEALNLQYNKNWLRTEMATAYGTGLSASEFMEKETQFKYVRWIQIDRDTKRPAHATLHGKIYRTEDIPAIPPIGWNCGCRIEYLEDWEVEESGLPVETKEDFIARLKASAPNSKKHANLYDEMKAGGFTKHKARAGEIFDLNKTYGDTFKLKSLDFNSYGLKPFRQVDSAGLPQIIRDTRSMGSVKQIIPSKALDYVNRQIAGKPLVTKANHKYVHQMPEVLDAPSEVFLSRTATGYKYTYLKYYQDGLSKTALRIEVDVTRTGGMKFKSFGPLVNPDRARRGVLVFNS